MRDLNPIVSVIIVHYNNIEYLLNCVQSIGKSTFSNIELIIVDNGAQKISPSDLPQVNLELIYIHSPRNLGFGDGCNQGIHMARGEFVFLLNNDIEIDPDCISVLVRISEQDPSIAIVQPKMLDLKDKRCFHSSGAGGMLDIFGYPFARGRILDTVEQDEGQYDDVREIFWASGAALFIRKKVLEDTGYFDSLFFMYMEEIDLIWRIHLLGTYKVVYLPAAKIYHFGGPNLGKEDLLRMYYVHRNSLIMLIKNYSWSTLLLVLPVRLILEIGTVLGYFLITKWKRCAAVSMAFGYIISHLPFIMTRRRQVQAIRRIKDKYIFNRMYKGSIVLMYLLGYRKASSLTFR